MKKIAVLAVALSLFVSCMPDDSGSGGGIPAAKVSFKFTHHWDGEEVTPSHFGNLAYTNENGDVLSITHLRYLVSNIRFHMVNGPSFVLTEYVLVDLENPSSMTFIPEAGIPLGNYDQISFTFGFGGEDNAENYPDLNSASWNWPEDLGGGYHFMQLEGHYETKDKPAPYAYHYGTARVSEGVFEINHFNPQIEKDFTLTGNTTMEIRMNIAEWFRNPNTWDLNEYNVNLMGNYEAQKMMQQNGHMVFSME